MERTAGIFKPQSFSPAVPSMESALWAKVPGILWIFSAARARLSGRFFRWDLRGTETPPIKASLPTPEIRCSLTLTCWRRTDF